VREEETAIAVVGCGKAKLGHAAPARELYVGSYFRACARAAETIAPGRWFILSAQYGLLTPADWIEPYDLTLGAPGSVAAPLVWLQAASRDITDEPVTALCGSRYAHLAGQVWAEIDTPLAGMGIGRQLQVLARIAR